MDFVTIVVLFIVFCIVISIITGYRQHKYGTGGKVRMQLKDDETGRVVRSGTGYSYGSAAVDLCSKLYMSAPTSKISSIEEKISSINKVINEYRGRMKEPDLRRCEDYRNRLTKLLQDLKKE